MTGIGSRLLDLARDRRGATAIEYGLIVALIVIAIVAAIGYLGNTSGGLWGKSTAKIVAVEPD